MQLADAAKLNGQARNAGSNAEGPVDILCLCNWHGVGGAQLNAGMLASAFADRGYRSELCFLFEREADSSHGTEGASVLLAGKPRGVAGWVKFAQAIKREIVDRRPRAIIGFFPMSNVVGALAARWIGNCTMVATQRNPSDRQNPVVGYLERLLGGTGLYGANIAVSEAVAASFAAYGEKYRSKLQVVHNATPALQPITDSRQACRQRFAMPVHGPVLGILGRLHEQKNPRFALQVLAKVPDAQLYFAGEGPEEVPLRTQAAQMGVADRVHFLGSLSGADVTKFYRAIDVLLFCSIYEGFGRVLVEAMSQGAPVIASDISVAREIGGDAPIYLPFDAPAWAAQVPQLAISGPTRQRAITAGLQRAGEFTLQSMVDGYLDASGFPHRGAS